MAVMLEKSAVELLSERARVLTEVTATEAELRERAEQWRLTTDEASVLRRLDAIDFLLGDDC